MPKPGNRGRGPRIMRMGANGSGERMKEFGSRETGEGGPRSMRRHAKGSGISEAGKLRGGNVEIRESGTEGWEAAGLEAVARQAVGPAGHKKTGAVVGAG